MLDCAQMVRDNAHVTLLTSGQLDTYQLLS